MTHSNSFVSSASKMQSSATMRASLTTRVALWAAIAVLFSAVLLQSGAASAQNSLIHTTVVKTKNLPPAEGRDFWFSFMSNYWGVNLGGKYMKIYITSVNNCTAFVECEGNTTNVPITAYNISTFTVPEFWENESSGEIETKAVHVWSNTADLTVYDMSRNSATTDGSYIIPTIGWGTDYVVAAYGSLFEGGGLYAYDIPSEMVVTANQDNTHVDITPSCDCRQCTSGNVGGDANSTIVMYAAGSVASFTLNKGEDVEMMPVRATDPDNFDMTGTIVHANQPVGVSGGSVCPNIPADYTYCDHVEDMMPPIRTWAETYYATNYEQPPNEPGKDFARYLFISSVPGQTIYGHNCEIGDFTEVDNMGPQYSTYWDERELGEKFWSNAPFLCVSYINSATYPDNVNGLGDPAETIINPKEQFTKEVVFETPSGTEFTNYANIIYNILDKTTTFDGKPVTGLQTTCVDDTFGIINISKIAPGVHRMTSDSGAGVYIYGYGPDESYAWAGGFGTGTFHSPDTIPPLVDTTGECFSSFIHVTDSGYLPGGVNLQSGLGEIRVESDSSYNMSYLPDAPPFVEGSGQDTSGYGMFVTDPSKPARLIIEVYDIAGNRDSITSIYEPIHDTIVPPLQNLGVWIGPGTPPGPNIAYDTLYNLASLPFNIKELQLLKGNVGFTLHDSIGGPLDLSPIPDSGRRIIQIQFEAIQATSVVDSILFGEPPCVLGSVAVIGSGGSNDFLVTSQNWLNEPYNGTPVSYTKTVEIENLSSNPITIDKGTWPDTHFTAVTTFPLTVPKSPGKVAFTINYTPDGTSLIPLSNRTQGTWTSPNVLAADGSESPRFDSLIGSATAPSQVFYKDTVITDSCVPPLDTVTAYFTLAETGSSGSTINRVTQSGDPTVFVNLKGTLTGNGTTWDPTKQAQTLGAGQSAVISVQYVMPVGVNSTLVDSITATTVTTSGATEDTSIVGGVPLVVTVNAIYHAGTTNPDTLTFGPVEYQSQNKNATQKSFLISNTTNSTLEVNSVNLAVGNPGNNAFTLTLETFPGGVVVPFPTDTTPYALAANQSLQVLIDFNDSLYNLPFQQALFTIATNSCPPISEYMRAYVTHPAPITYAYVATPILSCDNRTDNVGIVDSGANTTALFNVFDAALTIVSAKWVGPTNPGAYFSFNPAQLVGAVIQGSTNFSAPTASMGTPNLVPNTGLFPITFTPPAIPGGIVNYSDVLEVVIVNSDSDRVTEDIPVTGIAGGAQLSATSVIANQTHTSDGTSGNVNDAMSLPAKVSTTISVPGVQVSDLAITGAQLTYIIPNRDLLTLSGTGFTPDGSLSGWVTTNANGTPTPQNGTPYYQTPAGTGLGADTIIYMISGATALGQNTTSFGNLSFTVDLDQAGEMTPVTLQSVQLYTGGAGSTTPVGACVDTAVMSQNFSLILACGDTTLMTVMSGKGANIQFISPATPDPVTGGNVTMKYSNRGAASLTLAIYDALGNEVARPVNNVFHNAGSWQVTTDVSKLPSGTYTYRLSGTSATGPMAVSNQFVIQR